MKGTVLGFDRPFDPIDGDSRTSTGKRARMLLLDTHAGSRGAEGDTRKIGQRARRLIERAASHDRIRISSVTIFEVTAL